MQERGGRGSWRPARQPTRARLRCAGRPRAHLAPARDAPTAPVCALTVTVQHPCPRRAIQAGGAPARGRAGRRPKLAAHAPSALLALRAPWASYRMRHAPRAAAPSSARARGHDDCRRARALVGRASPPPSFCTPPPLWAMFPVRTSQPLVPPRATWGPRIVPVGARREAQEQVLPPGGPTHTGPCSAAPLVLAWGGTVLWLRQVGGGCGGQSRRPSALRHHAVLFAPAST
jgi:hypothetical protein